MAVRMNSSAAAGAAEPSRVLVVDDHRAFAEGVALYLAVRDDVSEVTVARTGEDAVEQVRIHRPSCVLLDIGLPGIDGVEATRRIKLLAPETRVVVITGTTTPELLLAAAEAGADCFIPKEAPLAEVVAVLRDTPDAPLADRTMLGMMLYKTGSDVDRVPTPVPGLTSRETDVLRLLADGVSVKAAARELGITINTCRGYVHGVLRKLDAPSQLAAVVKATRLGILRSPKEAVGWTHILESTSPRSPRRRAGSKPSAPSSTTSPQTSTSPSSSSSTSIDNIAP